MVFAFLFKDAHCIFHVFLSVFLFFPKRPATFSHLFPSLGFVDASRQCEPKALLLSPFSFSICFLLLVRRRRRLLSFSVSAPARAHDLYLLIFSFFASRHVIFMVNNPNNNPILDPILNPIPNPNPNLYGGLFVFKTVRVP